MEAKQKYYKCLYRHYTSGFPKDTFGRFFCGDDTQAANSAFKYILKYEQYKNRNKQYIDVLISFNLVAYHINTHKHQPIACTGILKHDGNHDVIINNVGEILDDTYNEKQNKKPRIANYNVQKRSFTCMFEGEKFGRYIGKTPKQAAHKVLSSIKTQFDGQFGWLDCSNKLLDMNTANVPFTFNITECTQGNSKNCFKYVGTSVKLDKPQLVKIGSGEQTKIISYCYNSKIYKIAR